MLRGRFARFPAPQLPPAFDRTGKPRGDRITLQLLSRSAKVCALLSVLVRAILLTRRWQAHLIHQQRALLEHMAAAHAAHQHWSSYAQTLTDRYRAVVRDLYELKLESQRVAEEERALAASATPARQVRPLAFMLTLSLPLTSHSHSHARLFQRRVLGAGARVASRHCRPRPRERRGAVHVCK